MQALKCDSFNYSFKKCDVMFIFLYHNWPSLSRDRQKLTIMNHCCYYFDGLCKVKTKYIILRLNALAKLQNVRGTSSPAALMGNWSTCSHMPWSYQSSKWFLISPFYVVWGAWDSVALRNVPLAEKIDMKCMKVNVVKNKARITRRLCILIMSHTHFRVYTL